LLLQGKNGKYCEFLPEEGELSIERGALKVAHGEMSGFPLSTAQFSIFPPDGHGSPVRRGSPDYLTAYGGCFILYSKRYNHAADE
jgi:hypothetical protein